MKARAATATRAGAPGGGAHFHHGPIDCLVCAHGDASVVAAATEQAWGRFSGCLDELVPDLPLLRADLSSVAPADGLGRAGEGRGPIARRMLAACLPYATDGRFITAMAAVAGSVAEELVACFDRPGITRAWVNNGGDIALHLAPGSSVTVGAVADLALAYAGHAPPGRFTIDAASPVRGVATSGWRGRSFSLGIADAVTILAATASAADAAATVVANAVDVDVPGIARKRAIDVRDDSDLGDLRVTVGVPALSARDVDAALDAGARRADAEIAAGRIVAAILQLQGRIRVCGNIGGSHSLLGATSGLPSC